MNNFPFKNFDQLKKAVMQGVVDIKVDISVARQLAYEDGFGSKWFKIFLGSLFFLIFSVFICFVIYIIISKNWFLLITLPILIIGFFVLNPMTLLSFNIIIRSIIIGSIIIILIWSLLNSIHWLSFIFAIFLSFWFIQHMMYMIPVKILKGIILNDEDLFLKLYENRIVIVCYDRNIYWYDGKLENGQLNTYSNKIPIFPLQIMYYR